MLIKKMSICLNISNSEAFQFVYLINKLFWFNETFELLQQKQDKSTSNFRFTRRGLFKSLLFSLRYLKNYVTYILFYTFGAVK